MKKFVLSCLMCLLCTYCFAQKINPDSLAYQLQRKKINNMLEVRLQKFGQYQESLSKHTGIFGMQTKKDIRRSNDIMVDIVKMDDSIFTQVKVLLDYKTSEQQKAQSKSIEAENYSLGYMNTINKLRDQVDKMKKDALELQKHQEKVQRTYIIIFVLMLGSILYLLVKKRRAKA